MLSHQKSASDRTGLGYGLSFSNTASTSNTVFVLFANNTEIENIDVKTGLVSENVDKGKSILGAPPKLDKKEIKNSGLRKEILKNPNRKSSISVITVVQLYILDLIVIRG